MTPWNNLYMDNQMYYLFCSDRNASKFEVVMDSTMLLAAELAECVKSCEGVFILGEVLEPAEAA